jgi:hypothetical protein
MSLDVDGATQNYNMELLPTWTGVRQSISAALIFTTPRLIGGLGVSALNQLRGRRRNGRMWPGHTIIGVDSRSPIPHFAH